MWNYRNGAGHQVPEFEAVPIIGVLVPVRFRAERAQPTRGKRSRRWSTS